MSIQAQIINLFSDLRDDHGVTFLFISHDLGVVEHLCDDVAVMYLGQLVETASRDALFSRPLHPYTRALLAAVPTLDPDSEPVAVVQGEIPDPSRPLSGCRFSSRCPQASDRCRRDIPLLGRSPTATTSPVTRFSAGQASDHKKPPTGGGLRKSETAAATLPARRQ